MSRLEAGHSPPKKWLYRIENSNTIRRPHLKLSGGSSNLVNPLDISRNSRNLSGFPKKHSSFQSSNQHITPAEESSPPKMMRPKLLPDIIFNKEKSVVTIGSKESNQRISPLQPSVGRPSYQNANRKLSTFLDQSAQKPFARHVSPYGNQSRGTRGIYFPSTPSLNPEEARLKTTSETPLTLRGEVRRMVSLHEKLVPIGGDAFSGRSSTILQPNESMNAESNDQNLMPVIHEQSAQDLQNSKEASVIPEAQQNYISVDQEISHSSSRQQPLNPRPLFKISHPPRVVDMPPFVESTEVGQTPNPRPGLFDPLARNNADASHPAKVVPGELQPRRPASASTRRQLPASSSPVPAADAPKAEAKQDAVDGAAVGLDRLGKPGPDRSGVRRRGFQTRPDRQLDETQPRLVPAQQPGLRTQTPELAGGGRREPRTLLLCVRRPRTQRTPGQQLPGPQFGR